MHQNVCPTQRTFVLGVCSTIHVYYTIIFPLLGLRVVGVEARGRRREECGAQKEGSRTHVSEEHCRM